MPPDVDIGAARVLFGFLLVWVGSTSDVPGQWRVGVGTEGIALTDVDVYVRNPDTLFAFGDQFLQSVDGGNNWVSVPGPAQFLEGALKVDRNDSRIVYVSYSPFVPVDPGETWLEVTRDAGYSWGTVRTSRDFPAPVVEIDPTNASIVYVGVGSGMISRTTDQGLSWEDLTTFSGIGLTSFTVAPTRDSTMYAGVNYGLYKSLDRGASWIAMPFGYTARFAVDPRDENVVYAAATTLMLQPGGLYKSTDGGITWIEKTTGFIPGDLRNMEDVLIDPRNPDELFLAKGSNSNKLIFRSSDGGENWYEFSDGITDSGGRATSLAIDTLNDRLFASTTHGIYRIDDLTSVRGDGEDIPWALQLSQNYPNPFNAQTVIEYSVARGGRVSMKLFNVLGQEIETLFDLDARVGRHSISVLGSHLSSGVYFYRIDNNGETIVRKMVVNK